ncbi:MAG: DUF1566 domain-containing protein [Nitrospina sp.]|jgi:hypothetical protein|nr:DUF1566 domain-containing protein [Nitrospina sp.]MBT6716183.1 DUF1566 domain-containing protein [Nitrospina sp.]
MSENLENKPEARFVEGDSDTIIDCAKRLVWLKQDTWQVTGKWMSQLQVREFAEVLNRKRFAGFSNWRLPTANEAKSLFDKNSKNSDNSGQAIFLSELFDSGCGFLCWTSDIRHKVQGVRLSFRKGVTMYDDIYRTSRGASRLVRDIEKTEDLI